MNKKEKEQVNENLYNIYSGILSNTREFAEGEAAEFVYDFDCPEYAVLREKYQLEKIAGKGTDFQRAVRLLRHFAPRLEHLGNYDNHVECNALALLEYCYDKKEVGINCLNKSKILEECCMALKIYARRVSIGPFSPYDFDSHVVTEIYDRHLNKWIMLDMTSNGYYIDENSIPLSCWEMREKIANQDKVSILYPRQSAKDIDALWLKNIEDNAYYAKNMFYISMDKYSCFGDKNECFTFLPKGHDLKKKRIANLKFKLKYADRLGFSDYLIESLNKSLEAAAEAEVKINSISHVWDSPIKA